MAETETLAPSGNETDLQESSYGDAFVKIIEESFTEAPDGSGELIASPEAEAAALQEINEQRARLDALEQQVKTDPRALRVITYANNLAKLTHDNPGPLEGHTYDMVSAVATRFSEVYLEYQEEEGNEDVLTYSLEKPVSQNHEDIVHFLSERQGLATELPSEQSLMPETDAPEQIVEATPPSSEEQPQPYSQEVQPVEIVQEPEPVVVETTEQVAAVTTEGEDEAEKTTPESAVENQEGTSSVSPMEDMDEAQRRDVVLKALSGDLAAFNLVLDASENFRPDEQQRKVINRALQSTDPSVVEASVKEAMGFIMADAAGEEAPTEVSVPVEAATPSTTEIRIDGSPAAFEAAAAEAEAANAAAEVARVQEREVRKQMRLRQLEAAVASGDVRAFDELLSLYPNFKPDLDQTSLIRQAEGGDQVAMSEVIEMVKRDQAEHDERARIENDPAFILGSKNNSELGRLAVYDVQAFNILLSRFDQSQFTDEQRAMFQEAQSGDTEKLGLAVAEIKLRDDEIIAQRQAEAANESKSRWKYWDLRGTSFKEKLTLGFWKPRFDAAFADFREFRQDRQESFLNRGVDDTMDDEAIYLKRHENQRNFMIGAQIVGLGVITLAVLNNLDHNFNGGETFAGNGRPNGAGNVGDALPGTIDDNGGGNSLGGQTGAEGQGAIEFQPDPAMDIPSGGGGEALFNRMGMSAEQWYSNEFELLSKFPDSFYPLDGHVGIAHSGPLPREVQEFINSKR